MSESLAMVASDRERAGDLRGRVLRHRGGPTHIDACRWFSYRALWLADRGQPYTKESAMTEWWAPRLAVETIRRRLLFHGHYGDTDELPFEQRMRDVSGLEIDDGAAEVMKMVVARELMRRESLPY
jgi:cyclohexanecarboxyl-CoA dehydrogenase